MYEIVEDLGSWIIKLTLNSLFTFISNQWWNLKKIKLLVPVIFMATSFLVPSSLPCIPSGCLLNPLLSHNWFLMLQLSKPNVTFSEQELSWPWQRDSKVIPRDPCLLMFMSFCNTFYFSSGSAFNLLLSSRIWREQWDVTPMIALYYMRLGFSRLGWEILLVILKQ